MDSFESMLTVGGKTNSLGLAGEVIKSVYSDPSRLEELFDCIFADNAWVRMRAIDSFEKIIKEKPEWVQPYLDRIFNNLTQSSQPSIQWHLAQLFSEVQLTDKQRDRAIAWLKNKIKTTDIDWIVSVNVMKALVYFHQDGAVTTSDLKYLLKTQESHTSKSVRKKAAALFLNV
jgi:hypothetical protein